MDQMAKQWIWYVQGLECPGKVSLKLRVTHKDSVSKFPFVSEQMSSRYAISANTRLIISVDTASVVPSGFYLLQKYMFSLLHTRRRKSHFQCAFIIWEAPRNVHRVRTFLTSQNRWICQQMKAVYFSFWDWGPLVWIFGLLWRIKQIHSGFSLGLWSDLNGTTLGKSNITSWVVQPCWT
jgi:hypothetical protein